MNPQDGISKGSTISTFPAEAKLENPSRPHRVFQNEKLHVITVIANPNRYESRIKLADKFAKHILSFPRTELHIIECTYFGRTPELDHIECDHYTLDFGDEGEFFLKEGPINYGFRSCLPSNWTKAAWIDADLIFTRPTWVEETLFELDHYPVLQPWSDSVDLGPSGGCSGRVG